MDIMWYHLDLAVGDERPTVDTVIDRMYIPSPEKGAGDCDINHRTMGMIFTFGKDSGL